MLTMQEARGKAYDIFPPQVEGDRRTKQINIVKYIEHLASTTHTVVDEWPVLDVFMNAETKLLYTDRSKINEIFFKFRESMPEKPTKAETVTKVMEEQINAICEDMINAAVQASVQNRSTYQRRVSERAEQLRSVQYELVKIESALNGLSMIKAQGHKTLAPRIRQILEGGFYSFHEIQNRGIIRLKTKPITLTYLNRQQGATNVVPMGWYVVEIRIQNSGVLTVKVWPGGDNPRGSDRCTHPHVSSGEVCFGNMLNTFSQAAASFDFSTVAEVVKDVLTNYNDGNPHMHLYNFEESWKAKRFSPLSMFYPDMEMPEYYVEEGTDETEEGTDETEEGTDETEEGTDETEEESEENP